MNIYIYIYIYENSSMKMKESVLPFSYVLNEMNFHGFD